MSNQRWISAVAGLLFGLLFAHFAVASSTILRPGSRYTIDVWDTEDGLPQNSVISMIQTRDGYLWLGTVNGLARFDGTRFTLFDGNSPELKTSRIIVRLFEDSEGNLWVGTETGGVVLVKKNGQAVGVDIGRGSREGRLSAACEDANGAIWLYTVDGQLGRYWKGKVDIWNAGQGRFSSSHALIAEKSGPLWVGTDWGLFSLATATARDSTALPVDQMLQVNKLDYLLASRTGGHWRLVNGRIEKWNGGKLERDFGNYPWTNSPVAAACEDRQGNLVVGTRGSGVFWFDADGKATRLSTAQGLSHDYILSLVVDREGSLWVGTDGGGLDRVKPQVFDVLEDSRGATVQSVCTDGQDGVWFSLNGRDQINYWNNGAMKNFVLPTVFRTTQVRSLFVDTNQQVWAGTRGGGLFQLQGEAFERTSASGAINPEISVIYQDRGGQLWVGTQGGLARKDGQGWKMFTTFDGLPANDVHALAEDTEGNLWIGTSGGLSRWRDGRFISFEPTNGVSRDNISCLLADKEGVLWIGMEDSGLARWQQGKFSRFTTSEGLAGNNIGYLADDERGNLWLGSLAGLMRVSKRELAAFAAGNSNAILCRTYRTSDGLPSSECTQGSQPLAGRTRDGKLWLATVKGLVSVNPEQLQPNTNPPPVVIESVFVAGHASNTNGLRAPLPETITIPPGKEQLDIQYTSLNLAAPQRARFKYRMEGHETAWTEVGGDSRVARYRKLPPGHYHFRVIAANEDGVWNETGASVGIVVLPPFWRTWWFMGASAVATLLLIIAVVHFFATQKLRRQLEKHRQQEAVEKERARIARDIHDQLGASLTQVALLGELAESDKDSPAEVEAHARQISQTARDTSRSLDEIVWTVNPSNDTLEGLINYISKYAQEYLNSVGLRCRLDMPAQLPAATVSPEVRHNVYLAAKEAITNIAKHAQASSAWVQLKLTAASFTLEISDDGRGPAAKDEKSGRNGLRNMRKRMEDVGGSFAIEPRPEGGTVVRLTAPIKTS